MNRRDFIKSGVLASAALSVSQAIASPEPIGLSFINRMERYKAYNEILEQNYAIGAVITDIAHEAAIAVPECGYVPLENGFQVTYPYIKLYRHAFDLAVFGDLFYELIFAPHDTRPLVCSGPLPAGTMYRIETIKGKLLEFQQSKDGPDYAALSRPIDDLTSVAVRFRPNQIFQLSIGPATFHPYGVSLLEPIRKDKSATIGQGAIKNFQKVFVDGMAELSRNTVSVV